MDFLRKYSLILGISILILVFVILFSSSDMFFASGVTFIDIDLYKSSGDETYVRTKVDFGSLEYMNQFPLKIGDWYGKSYDSEELKELLGADTVVQLGYVAPGNFQPIFLSIVQARTNASFHQPKVCYSALGYDVEEEGKEHILIQDASWTQEHSDITLPMKKLVVVKESDGIVRDRRVSLFFYVKGNQFTTDTITMIRYEAVAPLKGSYEHILNMEKKLAADTIPYMFEPSDDEDWEPIVLEIAGWGVLGYLVIVFVLSVPLAIIVFPRTKWGRSRAEI
jgi:hypothetical protein